MTTGRHLTPWIDSFSMAFDIINHVEGSKLSSFDEKYRTALREIAEGRLTFINPEIIRRGQGTPLLEALTSMERERAALILGDWEVCEQ